MIDWINKCEKKNNNIKVLLIYFSQLTEVGTQSFF